MFWLRDPPVLSDCHRHLVTGSFVEESEGSSSCSIFETALQDWLRHDGSGTTVLCLLFLAYFCCIFSLRMFKQSAGSMGVRAPHQRQSRLKTPDRNSLCEIVVVTTCYTSQCMIVRVYLM